MGVGISFIRDQKKMFLCGTFALLSMAIVYHSVYNALIQSRFKYLGASMSMLTYLIIITISVVANIRKKNNQQV